MLSSVHQYTLSSASTHPLIYPFNPPIHPLSQLPSHPNHSIHPVIPPLSPILSTPPLSSLTRRLMAIDHPESRRKTYSLWQVLVLDVLGD